MASYILLFFKGILIGIANIIPGVSGGTFALILGIYERLINALANIGIGSVKAFLGLFLNRFSKEAKERFKHEMEKIDIWFLVVLALGAMVSILGLSFVMDLLLRKYPSMTLSFFMGLILPSVFIPWKLMGKKDLFTLFWLIPGIGLTLLVSLSFNQDTITESNFLFAFISGVLAISAMILPGISGSFVLLVLGQYQIALFHLQNLQLKLAQGRLPYDSILWLGFLGIGIIVGLIGFCKFLKWLLSRYYSQTMAFLIGLIIGSLWTIWPFKDYIGGAEIKGRGGEVKQEIKIATAPNRLPRHGDNYLGYSICFITGVVSAVGVEKFGKLKKREK